MQIEKFFEKIPYLFVYIGISLGVYYSFSAILSFNRIIYFLLIPITLISIIINSKLIHISIKEILLFLISLIFIMIDLIMERGSKFTSYMNIVIFGYIFYILAPNAKPELIFTNLKNIFKFLIILLILEQLLYLSKLVDEEYLQNINQYFYLFSSKTYNIIYPSMSAAQSIYFGPQIGSMIALFGIILFLPQKKAVTATKNIWFYLSLIIFSQIFTFTSVLMMFIWIFLRIIFLSEDNKFFLRFILIYIFITVFPTTYFFTHRPTANADKLISEDNINLYLYFFTDLLGSFISLENKVILFGMEGDKNWSLISSAPDFGFALLITELGIIFIILITIIVIQLLFELSINKKNQIYNNSIIMLIILISSLSHYLVIFKTGPALLFAYMFYLFLILAKNNKYKSQNLQ